MMCPKVVVFISLSKVSAMVLGEDVYRRVLKPFQIDINSAIPAGAQAAGS
jgi:hypothetical protein